MNMHQDKTIQLMSEELSITKLAMAQLICIYERENGYKGWNDIANDWRVYAAKMPLQEWLAGKYAILHYMSLLNTKSAIQAIALLNSPQSNYQQNKQLYRGIFRSRGGKTEEIYKRGHERLMVQFLELSHQHPDIDLHGATRGAFTRIGELLQACKSRFYRAKK